MEVSSARHEHIVCAHSCARAASPTRRRRPGSSGRWSCDRPSRPDPPASVRGRGNSPGTSRYQRTAHRITSPGKCRPLSSATPASLPSSSGPIIPTREPIANFATEPLCHEASARPVTRPSRLSATRAYRRLSGWNLPPLVNRALGAHRIRRAKRSLGKPLDPPHMGRPGPPRTLYTAAQPPFPTDTKMS